ncbi:MULTISPECIES: hypothetical protein [unclassified Bacillus (in: firmicutes)]|uniref:hypothetical protein n=1 Tax=unclassified Bacillus (in: firmicutes) TaxID=185979 RepID=UPI001BEA79C0|nr:MULTISPECIES: hypothetical protein [unclassified Bacillus (in: firmicutes)]MBT2720724.1 hypothetical protein [Bacillus sp. ISL-46]MBT2741001.1 hypothetical protein [Bacillus sp. ISL-77]
MSRYLKLVNFEFNRFWKLYIVLIGVTIFSQLIGVIVESRTYVNQANQMIYEELIPMSEFIEQNGTLSFYNISQTLWFMGPIGLCLVVLIIYVFFIWYRDWLGKNTFIYRLLMLPTARIHVYLAKATTILLFTLGLVALQLILLPIENQVLLRIVPNELRTNLSVYEMIKVPDLMIMFPNTFIEFILYYVGGMAAVFIVFTAILFERSFRMKGVFYGILYSAASIVIFLAPILVDEFILNNYFYPLELFFMELGTGFIVLTGAIWTGNFLITKKVRV